MSKGDSIDEPGGERPEREESEPETPAEIVRLIEELGSGGINAIQRLELAERDLRLASTTDPRLHHALDRAEQLAMVREILQELLNHAPQDPNHPTLHMKIKAMGNTAVRRIPRQREEE